MGMGTNDSAEDRPIDAPSGNRILFYQTLERHMERLVGAPYGIGGLHLNLTTISCLVLLTEQISDGIESFSANAEQYSLPSLVEELAEIGLDATLDPASTIQEMIQRGYMEVDDEGNLAVQKPTLSMAHLLDRIFPRMPGMNFVAYLIQTQDEVSSGRKDPAFAIGQFDETLQIHGVALKQENRLSDGSDTGQDGEKERQPPPKAPADPRRIRSISHPRAESGTAVRKQVPAESRIISAGHAAGRMEVKEFKLSDFIAQPEPAEESSEEPEDQADTETQEDTPAGDAPVLSEIADDEEAEEEIASGVEDDGADDLDDLRPAADDVETKAEAEDTEEVIDRHIAEFEDDLAMQCPLCKVAKVTAKTTATGKAYYRCSDRRCTFISWGRPHHLVCPRCNNPFLVEVSEEDGSSKLKCPRATCGYRQEDTGPPEKGATDGNAHSELKPLKPKKSRRRVRRRVVRKKR